MIIASAVIKLAEGEEGVRTLKISAVGKYTYVTIN